MYGAAFIREQCVLHYICDLVLLDAFVHIYYVYMQHYLYEITRTARLQDKRSKRQSDGAFFRRRDAVIAVGIVFVIQREMWRRYNPSRSCERTVA